ALELHHAIFDINGTLAVNGKPLPNVATSLKSLADLLSIHLLTAGTHGNLKELEESLGFSLQIITDGEEKARYVQQQGAEKVVAFGNGANDAKMLRMAALGIAVLSSEGVAISALQAADVLVHTPIDAIELLLYPKRLIATLRG
ncbi:MAG TPA: HAD hydrolase family protein, partial [Ktedonobacteraceae bacterium]|nr:HAD hydrolase family protein [Ktedonobacteraceae bacterium]